MMKLVFVSILACSNAISRESEMHAPPPQGINLVQQHGQAESAVSQAKQALASLADKSKVATQKTNAFFGQIQKMAGKAIAAIPAWQVDHTKDDDKAAAEYLASMDGESSSWGESPTERSDAVEYKEVAGQFAKSAEGKKLNKIAAQELAAKNKKEADVQKDAAQAHFKAREIEVARQSAVLAKAQAQAEAEKKAMEWDTFDNFMTMDKEEEAVENADNYLEHMTDVREKLRLEAVAESNRGSSVLEIVPDKEFPEIEMSKRVFHTLDDEKPDEKNSVLEPEADMESSFIEAKIPSIEEQEKAMKEAEQKAHEEQQKMLGMLKSLTKPGNFHEKSNSLLELSQTVSETSRESIATQECQCKQYGNMGAQVPHGVEHLCETAAVTNGLRANLETDSCEDSQPGYRKGYSLCKTGRTACLVPAEGLAK